MKAVIFVEGGGDSKELHVRCREGFRKLLESCGYAGRMPRIVACGGRGAAYKDFVTAFSVSGGREFVAMLIDSELPLADVDAAWQHLSMNEGWRRPAGARDEQVLFMTTCMETWIVADRNALTGHYGSRLQVAALPSLHELETRQREAVLNGLERATRDCPNAYKKGKRSFEVLAKLNPGILEQHLPSFSRMLLILNTRL